MILPITLLIALTTTLNPTFAYAKVTCDQCKVIAADIAALARGRLVDSPHPTPGHPQSTAAIVTCPRCLGELSTTRPVK